MLNISNKTCDWAHPSIQKRTIFYTNVYQIKLLNFRGRVSFIIFPCTTYIMHLIGLPQLAVISFQVKFGALYCFKIRYFKFRMLLELFDYPSGVLLIQQVTYQFHFCQSQHFENNCIAFDFCYPTWLSTFVACHRSFNYLRWK